MLDFPKPKFQNGILKNLVNNSKFSTDIVVEKEIVSGDVGDQGSRHLVCSTWLGV